MDIKDFWRENWKYIILSILLLAVLVGLGILIWKKSSQPIPPVTSVISNGQNQQVCLDPNVQQQIANEINKKLNEINACDCSAQIPIELGNQGKNPNWKKIFSGTNKKINLQEYELDDGDDIYVVDEDDDEQDERLGSSNFLRKGCNRYQMEEAFGNHNFY